MSRSTASWVVVAWFGVLTLVNVSYYLQRLHQLGTVPMPASSAGVNTVLSVVNGLKRDFWLWEAAIAIVCFLMLVWITRLDKAA